MKPRLKGFAAYGVARMLVEALLGARGLVLAAILGPEIFGVWALFRITLRYCGAAGLGVLRGLEVEASAPRAAEGARVDAARVASARTALGFVLLAFAAVSLVAAVVAGLLPDYWLAPALAGVAAGLVFDRLWHYGITYLRATSDLWRLAAYELVNAGLQVVLVVALALVWSLEGALLGFVLANGLALLLLFGRVPARPALSLERLGPLLRTGFPVGVSFFLLTSLATIDRVVVAVVGGPEPLGYYAFAVSLSSAGAGIAFVIRTLAFPEVYRDARAKGALEATSAHLRGTLAPFAWVFAPALGVLALALEPAVHHLVPAYESAVPAARMYIFTGVVMGLANLGTLGVVAAERQWLLPLITGGALILNLGLAVAALASGLGLAGLAAGALLGRTVYASAIIVAAGRGAGMTDWPILLARTLLPLIWCAGVVGVLGHLAPVDGALSALVVAVVYTLALLPLVPFARTALSELRASTPAAPGARGA